MSTTLVSMRYFENIGEPAEWSVDTLSLRPVNLIVGKNATGKSRTMNVIWNLALALLQKKRLLVAGFDLVFRSGESELKYNLQVKGGIVLHEEVIVDGRLMLKRTEDEAKIHAFALGDFMNIKPPANELAAVVKRDDLQHDFLSPLHEWASGVRHYSFGDRMGRGHAAVLVEGGGEADDSDEDLVAGIFRRGQKEYGEAFTASLVRDMQRLGYGVTEVLLHPFGEILEPINRPLHGLSVKEIGIGDVVIQNAMSQGMFRALSILVHVTFAQMGQRAHCILIDDIGEGLDFERSSILIDMLREKSRESGFQLVMTTNDRFVMNHVPLDEWSVLQRNGCHVVVKNNENSQQQFEEFKLVGLSNFAFFEMDFVNGGPEEDNDIE